MPESKLARKREERLRKTAEKEERERSSDSRLGSGGGAPGISPGIRVAHNLTPNSYSSLHDRMELDRMEKEKRDREMAELRDRENRSERRQMVRYGTVRYDTVRYRTGTGNFLKICTVHRYYGF